VKDDGEARRNWSMEIYGPIQERNIRNVFIKKLIEGYGYSDKIEIAKRLTDDFLETLDEFLPSMERLKPGQLVWLARSKDDKGAPNKSAGDTPPAMVVLDLVTSEEMEAVSKNGNLKPLESKRMIRIGKDAEKYGGYLSQADLGLITLRSRAIVSSAMVEYQKETGKTAPTTGNKLDIGPARSHKALAIDLYAKGYNPLEISRRIDHDLTSVEKYIDTMERVKILAPKESVHTMAMLLNIGPSLVRTYLEIIKKYWPECVGPKAQNE